MGSAPVWWCFGPSALSRPEALRQSRGGSTSPLEEHAGFLLGLITEQPDLTLDEVVAAMRKRGIPGSRSAVWRFFDRRDIGFKKNFVRCGAKARGGRSRAPTLDAKARYV